MPLPLPCGMNFTKTSPEKAIYFFLRYCQNLLWSRHLATLVFPWCNILTLIWVHLLGQQADSLTSKNWFEKKKLIWKWFDFLLTNFCVKLVHCVINHSSYWIEKNQCFTLCNALSLPGEEQNGILPSGTPMLIKISPLKKKVCYAVSQNSNKNGFEFGPWFLDSYWGPVILLADSLKGPEKVLVNRKKHTKSADNRKKHLAGNCKMAHLSHRKMVEKQRKTENWLKRCGKL